MVTTLLWCLDQEIICNFVTSKQQTFEAGLTLLREEMSTVAANIIVAFVALVSAIIYSDRTEFALQKIHEVIERKPGCNPIPSVGNVTLHYFAGRGRGEVIRLLMANAGIHWTETKFTRETWPDAKVSGTKSGLYVFGQGKY